MDTIIPNIVLTISTLFIILFLFLTIKNLIKLSAWVKTKGKVIDHTRQISGNGKMIVDNEKVEASIGGEPVYYPVIEFKDSQGSTHTFTSKLGSSDPSTKKNFDKSASLKVIYNPNNPEQASILNFGFFWMPSVVIGVLGLLFLAVYFSMIS